MGEHFCEFLTKHDLWLPSTFEEFHVAEGGTWFHQQTGKWLRGDYVALPSHWQLTSCTSWTMDEVDLALKKQDHKPAAVTIRWKASIDDVSPRRGNRALLPDSSAIMKDLTGDDCATSLTQLRDSLPRCEWTMDVHTHTALLQQGLQQWMKRRKHHRFRLPLRKAMSGGTWALVQRLLSLPGFFLCESTPFGGLWRDGGPRPRKRKFSQRLVDIVMVPSVPQNSKSIRRVFRGVLHSV